LEFSSAYAVFHGLGAVGAAQGGWKIRSYNATFLGNKCLKTIQTSCGHFAARKLITEKATRIFGHIESGNDLLGKRLKSLQ
jgi:hypothetical protein